MTPPTNPTSTPPRTAFTKPATLTLRGLLAAGLAYDAYVHAHLAGVYDGNPGHIGQGTLFLIEAAVAALTALLVLAIGRRPVYLLALVVAASALGAVLTYRYIDLGPLGPLPNMYEPVWYPEKTGSAIAEAVATLAALTLLLLPTPTRTNRRRPPRTAAPLGP